MKSRAYTINLFGGTIDNAVKLASEFVAVCQMCNICGQSWSLPEKALYGSYAHVLPNHMAPRSS